jgi:hypothetical protein
MEEIGLDEKGRLTSRPLNPDHFTLVILPLLRHGGFARCRYRDVRFEEEAQNIATTIRNLESQHQVEELFSILRKRNVDGKPPLFCSRVFWRFRSPDVYLQLVFSKGTLTGAHEGSSFLYPPGL